MHSFVALLATVATVSAAYVEPYQSSGKAYPSQRDYMHTVVEYPTYQRRAVAYKPASYQTPSPYSSDPAEYPEPTPYPSKKPYDPEYEYSYSSSSSSMPAGSFIDDTGVADLDDNLANLPKREYAKTYGNPPSYSSPAPTPYPSSKPYDPSEEYSYSYSSSSSSMPAGSFIDNTGVADLDNLLAGRGEYPKKYPKKYTSDPAPSYSAAPSYSYSASYSYSYSSSSSSAPAGSAAAGGLPGLGGLLGGLPIRRHEPTGTHQVPHPSGSAKADPLGGLLGDLPLA